MSCEENSEADRDTVSQSIQMFKAVVNGETYEAVAERFSISRTAVERRIKAIAVKLSQVADIDGLNEDGAAFVRRLRLHRDAIMLALAHFDPRRIAGSQVLRIVSLEEIALAGRRIKARSGRPWHDLALFYLIFATGARPLEIARLEVRDYLNPDGSVRRASEMRAEVAITGKARPLYFVSTRLDEALGFYLDERLKDRFGIGDAKAYRGLDPASRLFMSVTGDGFKITRYGNADQRRFLCRPILETYRKLFRYGDLRGVTALAVRRSVVARLYERGADEDAVGLILGISERSAVRELLARPKPTAEQLLSDLV
ncbi:site-specific integrase [Aquabacterium sp. CECT 9606]|uniref:site-specific integrase n=1 Tax=Aquabacterium sp. CECT 9606 TaxID=2845822 RepID=UPI001E4E148C|nr:site-specific integrase [Aquabacterium sp. CECT 9606]CAH0353455.1 hypothetical protein AQB9606_03241 [Aquabacterium sp. CECT 9606]